MIISKDGEVRGATLKVGSKDGTSTVLQRPLQLLYPLEINSGPLTPPASGQEDDTAEQLRPSTPQEKAEPPRSRRKAALKARQLIRVVLKILLTMNQWSTGGRMLGIERHFVY